MKPRAVTLGKHISHLFSYFFIVVACLLLFNNNDNAAFQLVVFILLAYGVITLRVHLQYYLANRHVVVVLNLQEKVLEYFKEDNSIRIQFSDIIEIEKHQSVGASIKRGFLPTDNYSYINIKTKTIGSIVITSLIDDQLEVEMNLEDITVIKKRSIATIL